MLAQSSGVGFYDLYKLFQKYLEKYGNALKTKLKGYDAFFGKVKTFRLEAKSDDNSLRTICAILNTADFCSTTAKEVELGIKQAIDDRFKEKVSLKSTFEMFDGYATRITLF